MEKEKVRMAGGNEVENILLSIVVFTILLAFSLTKWVVSRKKNKNKKCFIIVAQAPFSKWLWSDCESVIVQHLGSSVSKNSLTHAFCVCATCCWKCAQGHSEFINSVRLPIDCVAQPIKNRAAVHDIGAAYDICLLYEAHIDAICFLLGLQKKVAPFRFPLLRFSWLGTIRTNFPTKWICCNQNTQ